jgi:hypothetical protein
MMGTVDLKRYTVVNAKGEFLKADNLLLLPAWTQDLRDMWLTYSELEAQKVAHQSGWHCLRLERHATGGRS